ncbi:MAG: Atg14 domain-containing protein [Pseudomonadota bacterium]|nr:Atg14 domain-containing protein [Pseudomonadota bacterium]
MQRDSLVRSVPGVRIRRCAALTSLCVLASVCPAWAAPGTPVGSIFTCNVSGKTFSGDRMPPECANSEVRELNRDGSLRRVIARPLTQDELRARANEAKKRLEDEDKQLAQRRRDKSLLEAYASDEEIEAARAKSLESAAQAMARAKQRIDGLNGERKKLDDEAEFYKKRVLPDQIKRSFVSNEQQIGAEEKILNDARAETRRINELFDAQKRRFRELLAQGARPVQRNPETDILLDPRFQGK